MAAHPAPAGAYLFFWPGQFLYIGSTLDTHTHDHHALQVVISLDKPFQIRANPERIDVLRPDYFDQVGVVNRFRVLVNRYP